MEVSDSKSDIGVVDKNPPKTEAESVGLWRQRISIANSAHDEWSVSSGAKRFVEEYKGDFKGAGMSFYRKGTKVPIPVINDVFAYVQSDIAATYNRDPYLTVNPKAGTVKAAKIWEAWLNYQWRELKLKEEMELEIIDKDLIGYAFHKTGNAVSSEGTGDKLKIVAESIYSTRIDWRDMFWNIGARRPPKDCQWMAQRIVRSLQDIKDRFPDISSDLKGSKHPDVGEDTYKTSSYKDDIEVGIYYEIWSAQDRTIYLMADGLKDKWLSPPRPWPDYMEEFPFLMYWDYAIPGSARPMSAIAPWEPQTLEEMVLMAQAINHSKRWNRQLFYNGGQIDEDAADKYERGDDGAMIRIQGKVGAEDLRFVDYGNLPTDFYMLMDRLKEIKRNVNGLPEIMQGGVTKTATRTQGELAMIQEGAKGRSDRRVDRLETHLENVARQMMACMKANFDFEQVIKVTGETPDEVINEFKEQFDPLTRTIKFKPEDIVGDYDVEVKAGSTLPLDKQHRIRLLETILPTIAQVASNGPLPPLLFTIIKEILDNMEIKSLQQAFEMEQQQAQQAAAQESAQKDSKQAKDEADTEKRSAQAQQVKADTEITMQEAALGPVGRTIMERAKQPPPQSKSGMPA